MGTTKTEGFTLEINRQAELLKAIAHPARLAILKHIAQVKSCFCGDLVPIIPLAQPTISLHLKALRQAGIIKGTINGSAGCFCINPEILTEIIQTLNQLVPINTTESCC